MKASNNNKFSNNIQFNVGNQLAPKSVRKNPKIVLSFGPTHYDVLVVRRSYVDFSSEEIDLMRHWLQARRALLALDRSADLPLPGGMFNHVDLSGCHVRDKSGRKHFWDNADPSVVPGTLDVEMVAEVERRLRFEISKTKLTAKEGPALFIEALVPKASMMRACDAEQGLIDKSIELMEDDVIDFGTIPKFKKIAVFERSGRKMVEVKVHPKYYRNLQVRRISWEGGRRCVKMFSPTFWWGAMDAKEGFDKCQPKASKLWTIPGSKLPGIADSPEWFQDYTRDRGFEFAEDDAFVAHIYRIKSPAAWSKSASGGLKAVVESTYKAARSRVVACA